jgi:hypothetical protein
MPYVDVLIANASNQTPLRAHYEFGDETLEQIIRKVLPDVMPHNTEIVIDDEVIQDWATSIATCLLLGEQILIYIQPHVRVNVRRPATGELHRFLLPSHMGVNDLETILRAQNLFRRGDRLIYSDLNSFNLNTLTDGADNIVKVSIETGGPNYFDDPNIATDGGTFSFVDVSSENGPVKMEFNNKAPDWRICKKGLCLEGPCTNEKCKAFNQMVVMNMGVVATYQMHMPSNATKCPMCETHVEPETCAFNNCEWRYFGLKKLPKGPSKRVKGDWAKAGDNYYRFDPELSGVADWLSLAFECRESKTRAVTKQCGIKQTELSRLVVQKMKTNDFEELKHCNICYDEFNELDKKAIELPCK